MPMKHFLSTLTLIALVAAAQAGEPVRLYDGPARSAEEVAVLTEGHGVTIVRVNQHPIDYPIWGDHVIETEPGPTTVSTYYCISSTLTTDVSKETTSVSSETFQISRDLKPGHRYRVVAMTQEDSGVFCRVESRRPAAPGKKVEFAIIDITGEQSLSEAIKLHRSSDIDGSLARCSQIIEENPEFAEAYNLRGQVLGAQGNHDRAITDLDHAIQLHPCYAAAMVNRAFSFNEMGQYDRAIADLDRAIALDSGNATAFINRGAAWYFKGDYDKAKADFGSVCENWIFTKQERASACAWRASIHERCGDIEAALEDAKKAHKLVKENASYAENFERLKGLRQSARDQNSAGGLRLVTDFQTYAEAILFYTEYLEDRPDQPEAFYRRGSCYLQLGQYDQAITDFSHVLARVPKHAEALVFRGHAKVYLGRPQEAVADYTAAIDLRPEDPEIRRSRAIAHSRAGNAGAALADLNTILGKDPDHVPSLINRAQVLFGAGHWDDAMRDSQRAVELQPTSLDTLILRADLWFRAGKFEQAAQDYRAALITAPDHLILLLSLGNCHLQLAQYEQANALFSKAIALNPASGDAWINRGISWEGLGQLDKAIADVEKGLEIDRSNQHIVDYLNTLKTKAAQQ